MTRSRREFLKQAGYGLGAAAVASQLHQLGLITSLAAASPGGDVGYKALMLIFLAGGNDGTNTVVPKHDNALYSTYGQYQAKRGQLAIPRPSLRTISGNRMPGAEYGLHPSLAPIHDLWAGGDLAVVANVGTLAAPTTQMQYQNPNHPRPFQLFSHSDQIEQNQSCMVNGTDNRGWGGRMTQFVPPGGAATLPLLNSIAGSQLFINGGDTPLVVGDAATPLSDIFFRDHTLVSISPDIDPAFRDLVTAIPGPTTSRFVKRANEITDKAVLAHEVFSTSNQTGLEGFPDTGIGRQLLQVARIIQKSRSLSNPLNRQVFFCQLGGFDTHAYQLPTHAALLSQLATAMRAFYDWLGAPVRNWNNDVTTFTMSDFGRTLLPNGEDGGAGTDHAWANHLLVMGGSVNGGDFYGVPAPGDTSGNGSPFPNLVENGASDTDIVDGRGRWIPGTATEEYAAVFARWFGVAECELGTVFPNLSSFPSSRSSYLNFLSPASDPC